MKKSKLEKLVKEGLLDIFRKKQEEPKQERYTIYNMPMYPKAEDFLKLTNTSDEDKLKAFKSAWYATASNKETRASLETLLDKEPYSQLKDFVEKWYEGMAQYKKDIESGKVKRTMARKSSVGGGGDSGAGSSASRIAGLSGALEEQLRMKFLAGVITEAEYKEQLNGKGKKRG